MSIQTATVIKPSTLAAGGDYFATGASHSHVTSEQARAYRFHGTGPDVRHILTDRDLNANLYHG